MTRRAYVYFLLTFILGLLVGGWAIFGYGWYGGRWRRNFSRERVIQHLQQDLNLTDAQAQQLNQIIDEYWKKSRELQHQIEPQFSALREERRERIRKILTPEQLVKFNEIVQRSNERMKRMPPRPPPP